MNKPIMDYKIARIAVVVLILILGWKSLLWFSFRMDPSVRQLPKNASKVKFCDCSSFSDIIFIVKAKMNEDDFDEYVKNLGFVPLPDHLKEKDVFGFFTSLYDGVIFETQIDWWDPSMGVEDTYCDPDYKTSHGIMLKYENGYSYYLETTLFGWN